MDEEVVFIYVGIYINIYTFATIIMEIDAMNFRRAKLCPWKSLEPGKIKWKHNAIIIHKILK